jgi:hypothetical protein
MRIPDKLSKIGFSEAMVLTVTIVSVLLFVVWQIASSKVEPDREELLSDIEFLSSELDSVNTRYKKIQAKQVVVEREADVIRKANRLMREQESERQAELSRLQSEIDFFRRLAGTGGTQEGLDVYLAQLFPTESGRVYRFILTLTQNIRRASIVTGKTRMDIEGILNDRPVTLYWSQVSDGQTPEPTFRFKYFQQLEGYLTLPEDFSPTRLLVTLDAKGQRKPVTRNYDWNELVDD